MRYLHTMVRVSDLDAVAGLLHRQAGPEGGSPPREPAGPLHADLPGGRREPGIAQVELTYNWDPEVYTGGRNFGHLAYSVPDIYATCQQLMDKGVTINRPPRDGRMAFIKSPDGISIELLQQGEALPAARAVDVDAERRQLVVLTLPG